MLEHTFLMITHSFTTAFCLGHVQQWMRGVMTKPCSGLPLASSASHREHLPPVVASATSDKSQRGRWWWLCDLCLVSLSFYSLADIALHGTAYVLVDRSICAPGRCVCTCQMFQKEGPKRDAEIPAGGSRMVPICPCSCGRL